MKNLSMSVLIALLLLGTLLLAACGGGPPDQSTDTAPTALAERSGGIAVEDALGRVVEFDRPPQRIVVAGKSSLTIINTVYLFPEAAERVVGVTSGRQKPAEFLSLVDPAFGEKTMLAPDAGPEQIAPLAPEVVIVRSFMAEKLGKSLEQLDIPVVYVDLETPEQYVRDVAVLGQLFGNEVRAGEIQAYYRVALDRVARALQGVGEKPRILLVQYSDQGGEVALNVPSASWLQTMEIELAGGTPVWTEAAQGGGWTVVNFEQVAAWDPDQIYVIAYGSDSARVVDKLVADARWQALRAVQQGRIHGFGGDIFSWDQPDPRWILGVTWLADKMHPDLFAGLDLEQEVVSFFTQMYGMDEGAVRDQILPRLQGGVQ